MEAKRYQVVFISEQKRSWKWGNPVTIRVVDTVSAKTAYGKTGRGPYAVVKSEHKRVDRRGKTERSAFGRAYASAVKTCEELNATA